MWRSKSLSVAVTVNISFMVSITDQELKNENKDSVNHDSSHATVTQKTNKRYATTIRRAIKKNIKKAYTKTLKPIFEHLVWSQDNRNNKEEVINDDGGNLDDDNDFTGDKAAGFDWSYEHE